MLDMLQTKNDSTFPVIFVFLFCCCCYILCDIDLDLFIKYVYIIAPYLECLFLSYYFHFLYIGAFQGGSTPAGFDFSSFCWNH